MPIAAGTQLWPDGNHRVGMMVAENVAEEAGFTMVLDETDIEELRATSKRLVRERWARPERVTAEEFTDPDHPLRLYYEGYKHRLQFESKPGN